METVTVCAACAQLKRRPRAIVLPDNLRAADSNPLLYACVDCHAVWLYNADQGWFVRFFDTRGVSAEATCSSL
jgi:hypothetical protein